MWGACWLQVWDLAKCSAGVEGGLRLTLTGHISAVRALAVSPRNPYLFSCAEDKMVRHRFQPTGAATAHLIHPAHHTRPTTVPAPLSFGFSMTCASVVWCR